MKRTAFAILPLLLSAGVLIAAEPPAPAAAAAQALLQEAQKLARDRNLDVAVISNAFAKALAADGLPAAARAGARVDLAQAYLGRNLADSGHALLDQAVAEAAAAPDVRVRALTLKASALFSANFKGAFASYFTRGIDAAAAIHRQILAMPDVTNADRIAAGKGLANCLLEKMDVDGANAVLAEALALPGLSDAERETALDNQADAFYRQMEYARALPLYEALWKPDLHIHRRSALEGRILSITAKLKGQDAAIALMKNTFPANPMRLAIAYRDYGLRDEAIRAFDAILTAEQAKPKPDARAQGDALRALSLLFSSLPDFAVFQAEIDRRLATAPALTLDILNYMNGHPFNKSSISAQAGFVQWRADRLKSAMAAQPGRQSPAPDGKVFEAFIREGDPVQALAQGRALLAATNTPPAVREQARWSLIVLEAKDNATEALKRFEAAFAADPLLKTGQVARAETLLKGAQTAMRMRTYATARALYAAREKMRVPDTRPSLRCPYVANGPKTVAEFRDSPHFKQAANRARLDRKYGDNLQFLLETDAAMTGRRVTDGAGQTPPTEFTALCDDEGVKIFLFAPSPKARAVEAGFATLGGYEMYLAAGPNDPYDCFLIDFPPAGSTTIFNTQYDNMGYRQLSPDKDNIAISHRFYDDGVATLIAVSWTAYFNRLPANGSVWDFEVCHWDQGGRTWGGSKSVHNRSSFGALIFDNLTPANLAAIQRRLLPAAARVYRNALSSRNGYMEIWQDPELGDQAFFFDVIEPLQQRLSGYLPRVKYEMTDAEVTEVFEQAARDWMNIAYIVAARRRDYLDARRISGR